MGCKKGFFTVRIVKHCNKLHREVVVPHPWRQPRSGWMGSENPMELWVSLYVVGGLDQVVCEGSFQLKRFYGP